MNNLITSIEGLRVAAGTDPSLTALEVLCERLYNAAEASERAHAEQALRSFSVDPAYIPQCQAILDASRSPYAQLLAASSLVMLMSENALTAQIRLDMRTYVLNYLFTHGPTLASFVATSLIQLLARITKLGWFDADEQREIVKDATKFLTQRSAGHFYLGLKILNQLVAELNQPSTGRSLTLHRKTAVSFRDASLLHIFTVSLTSLQQLQGDAASEERLREQAVALALKCLSFDFVGTSLDESAEDLGTIQVPSAWRPLLEDTATMQLFFDVYRTTAPLLSSMALECLTRLASVRRSLFTSETERTRFLAQLMAGTRDILRAQQGLSEHANYHEYCRLLGRLKTNYQLSELVAIEHYGEWIGLVADFTIKSLQSWQWASGSVYYLLGLWSRLVSSMPYLKGDAPSMLEAYVPKITEAFVASRLESVSAAPPAAGAEEDLLDCDEALQDQLESLPFLCRFRYESSAEYLASLLDPALSSYADCASTHADPAQLSVLEGRLAWLVYIIAAVLRGRLNAAAAESQELVDGDLAARVFQLVSVADTGLHARRYGERARRRLDMSLLAFFQAFRKVYVGEQAMQASKVYQRLGERVAIGDHGAVLAVMVAKIGANLRCYASCAEVVDATLSLFADLAAGYMSGKLLLKLESVTFLLTQHTREHFPFLDEPANTRHRTVFYATLARLLFMDDAPSRFRAFVAPLAATCAALQATAVADTAAFGSSAAKAALVGLFRDLRGLAVATNSRRTYGLLFEWLYPAHMPLLLRAAEAWAGAPEVTTPLLKFLAEFALNKTQRLTFDSSSPNGILLFREISRLLVAYGRRALASPLPASDVYGGRYKGISIALTVLARALGGGYVNFGVFDLYGDPALKDALDVSLQLAVSLPLPDILAYRKVGRAYFAYLDVLCQNHIGAVVTLDTPTFSHFAATLEAGLKSLDVAISSQCAATVDSLAAFCFAALPTADTPPPPSMAAAARAATGHLAARPDLLPGILRTLFEIVLFEECSNQWSLSRPMLSLILVAEPHFAELKSQLAASQPGERGVRLLACFDRLMADVARSLEPKNRDKFTQNLTIFRHDFRSVQR